MATRNRTKKFLDIRMGYKITKSLNEDMNNTDDQYIRKRNIINNNSNSSFGILANNNNNNTNSGSNSDCELEDFNDSTSLLKVCIYVCVYILL